MKRTLKRIPKFRSEAAEREFWSKHDSTEYVAWSAAKLVQLPRLKPSTETISLRLPKHVLDSIRQMANARDIPYQSLIKTWLLDHLIERLP